MRLKLNKNCQEKQDENFSSKSDQNIKAWHVFFKSCLEFQQLVPRKTFGDKHEPKLIRSLVSLRPKDIVIVPKPLKTLLKQNNLPGYDV